MYNYKVRLSSSVVYRVNARNATKAKERVWSDIKRGYTYGYTSKSDFMSGVTAEREG